MAVGPIFWQAPGLLAVPGLAHAFSSRHGGVSPAPFDSLNLSATTADAPDHVGRNRALLLAALGAEGVPLVLARQVHGGTAAAADPAAAAPPEADGLYTAAPGRALLVLAADCVPVLLAHPSGGGIAAAHAGWRGTVAGVAANTLRAAAAATGLAPAGWRAAVGPAIGPCCFVVGAEAAQALQACSRAPAAVTPSPTQAGRWHVDLWQLQRAQLEAAGLMPAAVEICRACTACTPALFSHRRDAGTTGRQGAVILRRGAFLARAGGR